MQRLIYYTIYPVLWSISKLPWRLFYGLSSCIYYLVYYIIRYRRKTVTANLTLVFPEKNTSEINRIRKAFYKHMCDMFLEMIKSISITKEEMLERFRVTNIEDFHALEKENKSIVVLMGHYASYEWSSAIDLLSINPCVGIYKKVRNPYFDKMVHRIRGRFSARLIESHDVVRTISQDIKKGDICSYGMIADQSPKIWNAKYWTDFMGVTVPVFLGASLIARKFDLTVLYLQINKKKRGYYEATFVPIKKEDNTSNDRFYYIKAYLRLLENQIKEKPEYYLWTHKRWKHRNAEKPNKAIVD